MGKYDGEFKVEAVRLVKESGRSANEVSKEIGVPQATLSRWVRESSAELTGSPSRSVQDAELAQLRKEVRQLRMERDFLRDAAGYFAKLKKFGSPR